MIELAWAAGFFDGEGCVYLNGKYTLIAITQARREPLDRFLAALELGVVRGPYRNKSPYFVYSTGAYETQPVIDRLWPLLSLPKREQIIEVREKARDPKIDELIEALS